MAQPTQDLEVVISGEKYSLDVVPAADSKVVAAEKKKLLGTIDLDTLVTDLGCIGAFLRMAYNGVMAAGPHYTELQIEIQDLEIDVTKLCDQSALTISRFQTASETVLTDLEATYGYLLLNREKLAIETLSSVSKLAGDMEKAALELHDKFEKEEAKVTTTLKKTQRARGEAEVRIEEKEKDKQQLQIQLQHQQKLLDDAQRLEREAEAQRQQIEAKEDEAISGIKHIGVVKSLVNAIFRYEVFDEGTKKLDRWKEKRIQALENERKLRKQRYEAMERMTSFAIMIQNCQSEQELAKVAEDALHKTVGELQQLRAVIMQAALFWKQMHEHCKSLAEERVKSMITAIESTEKEDRIKTWTSKPFKQQAIRFYAGWVALSTVCSEYAEHIKRTQKELYKYIMENPTYEEARRNIHELAKNFLADLKKDQEAITEKEFEAQRKIEALRQD